MFKINYINELLIGQLSEDGYNHFLNSASYYVKKYNWPKNIIVSNEINKAKYWSNDDTRELIHQYFEWIISKGKLQYLNKIPNNYLSYYFLQMFISFVANRIKQEQQKLGLNYEKCKELVLEISKEDLINKDFDGLSYVYNQTIKKNEIKQQSEIDLSIRYLSKIPLNENTKHFKPLVKMAIEDIFNTVESPIPYKILVTLVFNLFDQKPFENFGHTEDVSLMEFHESKSLKHKTVVINLLNGLTKDDAKLILEYLFKSKGDISLSELALKYNLPKSTLHHKMESFKKKISKSYTPHNEEDGMLFIQSISEALDNHSN